MTACREPSAASPPQVAQGETAGPPLSCLQLRLQQFLVLTEQSLNLGPARSSFQGLREPHERVRPGLISDFGLGQGLWPVRFFLTLWHIFLE